jgi:4-alpha-glucanotransferase
VTAEDLGVIPDFVRETLARFGVPGYKVLRWEREWNAPGQPFRDPRAYPPASVATTGTHDTETVAEWWDDAPEGEREQLASLDVLRDAGLTAGEPASDRVRDAFLTALFASGSDLMIVPMQDVFGWRDRINTPALVSDTNWCWRLPWPVDALQREPVTLERARFLRALAERWGREPSRELLAEDAANR